MYEAGALRLGGDRPGYRHHEAYFRRGAHLPHCAWVSEIVSANETSIRIRQNLGSVTQVSEMDYPCLITVDKGINVPRLPSYRLKIATAERPVRFLRYGDMPDTDLSRYGLVGSPTAVENMFAPPEKERSVFLQGSPRKKAEELYRLLVRKKII